MNNLETATNRCSPIESRKKLIEMIKEKGTVEIKDVIAFRRKEGLYFGPMEDTFDFLLANQDCGILDIDPVKGVVSVNHNSSNGHNNSASEK